MASTADQTAPAPIATTTSVTTIVGTTVHSSESCADSSTESNLLNSLEPLPEVDPILASTSASSSLLSTSLADAVSEIGLQVERILRHRQLGDEIQYRVKWVGFSTETWVNRAKLLASDDEAKLVEYENWCQTHPDEVITETELTNLPIPLIITTPAPTASASTKHTPKKKQAAETKKDAATTATQKRGRKRKLPTPTPAGKKSSTKSTSGTATKRKKLTPGQRVKPDDVTPPTSSHSGSRPGSDGSESESESISSETIAALEAEGIYEVEQILNDVWDSGVHWYRVKWLGYSDFDNSWQRPEDLIGCAEQLRAYWKKKRERLAKLEKQRLELRRRAIAARKKAKEQRLHAMNSLEETTLSPPIRVHRRPRHSVPGENSSHSPSSDAAAVAAVNSSLPSSSLAVAPIQSSTTSDTNLQQREVSSVAATISSPTSIDNDMGEMEFEFESFPTLLAAQTSLTAPPSTSSVAAGGVGVDGHLIGSIEDRPIDYEDAPICSDSDDSTASTSSTNSTTSLLLHPQHKHAKDEPQCVIAHDWYECANDESLWLVLIKWKHKPVAECSWEPRNSLFLMGPHRKIITDYLKQITDPHLRTCIQKNVKP